jgi:hypothetical protein
LTQLRKNAIQHASSCRSGKDFVRFAPFSGRIGRKMETEGGFSAIAAD